MTGGTNRTDHITQLLPHTSNLFQALLNHQVVDSFVWKTWTIGVLICLNIIRGHWSFLKWLKRKDLHFQVGCSKTQALNPKVEQILFHKREQTSWKLLHTCLHTLLSQLRNSNRFQFSKAGQNRLQVAPKEGHYKFFFSLLLLTTAYKQKYRNQTNTWEKGGGIRSTCWSEGKYLLFVLQK